MKKIKVFPQDMYAAGNSAFAKLVEAAGESDSLCDLLQIALSKIPLEHDERAAGQLLLSILLHDELAEKLNSFVSNRPVARPPSETTSCPTCTGREGTMVYVPLKRHTNV